MSDFTYDSKDSAAMRVAVTNLSKAQCQGLWYAAAGSIICWGSAIYFSQKFNARTFIRGSDPRLIAYSLFAGSLVYWFD